MADSLSIQALSRLCAQQASCRYVPAAGPDPCYTLFCLALGAPPDQAAWDAIVKQYERLVRYWLGQHDDDDTCQEVFFRFWRAQQNATTPVASRFANTKAVLQYLKCCAVTVRIESYRERSLRQELLERLGGAMRAELVLFRPRSDTWAAELDLEQLILSSLKSEQEKAIFDATYRRGLPPREIQLERPDLFPDTQAVHRAKENLLKRLRRNEGLQIWWAEDGQAQD